MPVIDVVAYYFAKNRHYKNRFPTSLALPPAMCNVLATESFDQVVLTHDQVILILTIIKRLEMDIIKY